MVAVLMVPIIRRLYEGAGKTAKLVTIIHTAYLVLLAIIYVSWMGVYTYLSNESYTYYYGTVGDYLYIHYYRLSLAYDVLAVIGVLMAGINMVISMLRSKSSNWNTVCLSTLSSSLCFHFFNANSYPYTGPENPNPTPSGHGPRYDSCRTGQPRRHVLLRGFDQRRVLGAVGQCETFPGILLLFLRLCSRALDCRIPPAPR